MKEQRNERAAKDELRRRATERRRAVPHRGRLASALWSAASSEKVLRSIGISVRLQSLHIAAYVAVRDELDTEPFLNDRFKQELDVLLPRVDGVQLQLWRIESWEQLEEGHFGILEPALRLPKERLVAPDAADLIFVPGLAFDEDGGRLGYGKGHYDRLLSQLRHEVPRVGLCFEEQIVEAVPVEAHDVAMTHLVTPERVVDCRRA